MSSPGLPPLERLVGTDDVVAVLSQAGTPMGARQLRTAMGIDRHYLGVDVLRVLHAAVVSGRVQRSGTGAGTRYHVDDPPPTPPA